MSHLTQAIFVSAFLLLCIPIARGDDEPGREQLRAVVEGALQNTTEVLSDRFNDAKDAEGVKAVRDFKTALLKDRTAIDDRIATLKKKAGNPPNPDVVISMVNKTKERLKRVDLAEAKKFFRNRERRISNFPGPWEKNHQNQTTTNSG